MQNKLLKDLTFILTLKGRSVFTKRWLDHMSQSEFINPIIIADGDKDSKIRELISKNFKNLNIKHLQFNDQKVSDYYYKLQETLKQVQTKYIMMCDNDDFVLKSGVNDVLNFLNSNKEFISAGSSIVNFDINSRSNIPYGNDFCIRSVYKTYRYLEPENNFENRIIETFKNFQPNYYNIFERNSYKIVIDEIKEINFSDMFVPEFYIQLRILTLGKQMKLTSSVQLLRQLGTTFTNSEHFSKRLIKTDIPLDIRKLANSLAPHIAKINPELNESYIEKKILDSFSDYLTHTLSHYYARYKFKKLYKIKLIIDYFAETSCKLFNKFFIYIFLKKKIKEYKVFQNEIKKIINYLRINY